MSSDQLSVLPVLMVAPAQVMRGSSILAQAAAPITCLGQRPLVIGGQQALAAVQPQLRATLGETAAWSPYGRDCSEAELARLRAELANHSADLVIGVGGGKALDTAKLVAHQNHLPVVTIPTNGATCAAWTALSNVYSPAGAFQYDVPLPRCPELLILDYDLIATAPRRTLVAGIGDALAKWYEASVSSGHSSHTLVIAAVQQARVLRDILFQCAAPALAQPGSAVWREVVDASVLMAGMIGGLGGAQCRTVAAHAVHNGLTHLLPAHAILHGEKVAYGILVQLRLEEFEGNQLAATARHQLLKFYNELGLPRSLADLGLSSLTLTDLQHAAEVACAPTSDIHRLPFEVTPEVLLAAMVSTTSPIAHSREDLHPEVPA